MESLGQSLSVERAQCSGRKTLKRRILGLGQFITGVTGVFISTEVLMSAFLGSSPLLFAGMGLLGTALSAILLAKSAFEMIQGIKRPPGKLLRW